MAPPMQTQQAVRVGFELATDGIQIYVFANLDKTSLAIFMLIKDSIFDQRKCVILSLFKTQHTFKRKRKKGKKFMFRQK